MILPLISDRRAKLWHERARLMRELSRVKQQIQFEANKLDLTVKEARAKEEM